MAHEDMKKERRNDRKKGGFTVGDELGSDLGRKSGWPVGRLASFVLFQIVAWRSVSSITADSSKLLEDDKQLPTVVPTYIISTITTSTTKTETVSDLFWSDLFWSVDLAFLLLFSSLPTYLPTYLPAWQLQTTYLLTYHFLSSFNRHNA